MEEHPPLAVFEGVPGSVINSRSVDSSVIVGDGFFEALRASDMKPRRATRNLVGFIGESAELALISVDEEEAELLDQLCLSCGTSHMSKDSGFSSEEFPPAKRTSSAKINDLKSSSLPITIVAQSSDARFLKPRGSSADLTGGGPPGLEQAMLKLRHGAPKCRKTIAPAWTSRRMRTGRANRLSL